MYVTAHRVRSKDGLSEGVNAFYYVHGPLALTNVERVPDDNPGTLRSQLLAVPPPGNRVRSFVDIVGPDDATWLDVRQAFITLVGQKQLEPFPWSERFGACYVRIGMDADAARTWRNETALLFRAAQVVRMQA